MLVSFVEKDNPQSNNSFLSNQPDLFGSCAKEALTVASEQSHLDLLRSSVCLFASSATFKLLTISVPMPFYSTISVSNYWPDFTDKDGLFEAIAEGSVRASYRAIRMAAQPTCESTLGGRIVSEGLSHVFSHEMGYPYNSNVLNLSAENLALYAEQIKPNVFSREPRYLSDYKAECVFEDRDLRMANSTFCIRVKAPKYAGYNLAVALTYSWLKENKITAAQAIDVDCGTVLSDWVSGKLKLERPKVEKSRQPVSRVLSCS